MFPVDSMCAERYQFSPIPFLQVQALFDDFRSF
jgi:hypothetical protein